MGQGPHPIAMVTLQRANKVGRKYRSPVETRVGGFGTIFKVLPEFLFNRKQRFPQETPGPFGTDPAVYATPPASGLRVTWFGHSSMLVEIDGVCVLIDPVWDQRAAPVQWFGPRRFFPPTLRLDELPRLDAILTSHDHYDHLGKGTMQALARLQPGSCWVAPMGVAAQLRAFGVPAGRIEELNWLDKASITAQDGSALAVTAVPARHFSGRSLFNRNETLWTSYALRGKSHNVYYGADSGLWNGFPAIAEKFGPFDLTMLEIGAFNEAWKDIHLGPEGAIAAFESVGGRRMMPIHWGLFDLALHGWREPIERIWELADQRGIQLFSPKPGQPTEVGELRSDWWKPRE